MRYGVQRIIFSLLLLVQKFAASGLEVSETEKVEVILTGLSSDFDAILTLASFSMETLPFQHLVVLLEFESRKM